MNYRRQLCACAAAAAMLLAAMPAMATTVSSTRTNVPFAFLASGKPMPAGEYTIGKTSETVMNVRHTDGAAALALITRHVGPIHGNGQPRLVFVKKNGRYHLSEVHLGGLPGGEQISVK